MSTIGPQLPPHLRDRNSSESEECADNYGPCLSDKITSSSVEPQLPTGSLLRSHYTDNDSDPDVYGPVLPPNQTSSQIPRHTVKEGSDIGPKLPPHLKNISEKSMTKSNSGNNDDDIDEDMYGPALPPGYEKSDETITDPGVPKSKESQLRIIGPAMPSGVLKENCDNNEDDDDDGDADVIGPMPSTGDDDDYSAALEFERRSQIMKDKLEGKDKQKVPVRESWMTELPSTMLGAQIGLQARKFRANAAPEVDASSWTETPADRARQEKEGQESESKKRPAPEDLRTLKKDQMIGEQVEAYNKSKNRQKSLVDMHQTERKKIKAADNERDNEPLKRRAFDREADLQVNRFDDAQRKLMIKKSQQLNTKFSHGSSTFM